MSSGSRYINIIYCKTYFVMVALSVPTDRGWLALSVLCHAQGTGPRPFESRNKLNWALQDTPMLNIYFI